MGTKGGFKGLWGKKSPKDKSLSENPKNDVESKGEEELLDVFKSEAAGTGVSKEEFSSPVSKEGSSGKDELSGAFKTETVKAVTSQEESSPPVNKEETLGEDKLLDVFKAEKIENVDLLVVADGLEDLDVHDLLHECLDVANELRGSH